MRGYPLAWMIDQRNKQRSNNARANKSKTNALYKQVPPLACLVHYGENQWLAVFRVGKTKPADKREEMTL